MLRIAELLIKGLTNHLLARRKARTLSVRAVGQQAQHTAVAVLSKLVELHNLSINRCMVNLKVASVNNRANRRVYRNSYSIRNAVVYTNKVKLEGTGGNFITGFYYAQVFVAYTIFLQTTLQNTQSQCGTINGTINLLHNIRQRTNMVLVTMCQENALHLILVLN